MIEVVLHLVVLRETPQVRRLHLDEIIHGCLPNRESHSLMLNEIATKITMRSSVATAKPDGGRNGMTQ